MNAARSYARAALDDECDIVANARQGRNATLNSAALKLGTLVATGALEKAEVEHRLFEAATVSGYVAKDGPAAARATIASGLAAGMRQPRPIPAGRSNAGPSPQFRADTARIERARAEAARAEKARTKAALAIWEEAGDPRGTLAETYLAGRGLALDDDIAGEVLRFHPSCPWNDAPGQTLFVPALIALMRAIAGDEPQAIHRTRLTPEGGKVGRKMLGAARGAAIKLDADENVTMGLHIGEGLETVMSGRQLDLRPAWALGSAGAIRTFPVLSGIEALTLLAENDQASRDAVEACAKRWASAGNEVDIVEPLVGKDLNDCVRGTA